MARMERSRGACCLRMAWDMLVTFGGLWVQFPQVVPASTVTPPGEGPAPRHPERLCPERPLTPVERRLREELRS